MNLINGHGRGYQLRGMMQVYPSKILSYQHICGRSLKYLLTQLQEFFKVNGTMIMVLGACLFYHSDRGFRIGPGNLLVRCDATYFMDKYLWTNICRARQIHSCLLPQ